MSAPVTLVVAMSDSTPTESHICGPVRPGEDAPIDQVQYGESLIECMEPKPKLRVGRPTRVGYLEYPRYAVDTKHEVTTLRFYDDHTKARLEIVIPVHTWRVWHE